MRIRILLAASLFVSLLLGIGQTVSADPATHYTVHLKDTTISWRPGFEQGLGDSCAEVPAGVLINPDENGSNHITQASEKVNADGSKHIVLTDLVQGTATDQFGTGYKFTYEANKTFDYDGDIVNIAMQDTFKITGGEVNYTTGFNRRWAYEAGSLDVVASPENLAVLPFVPPLSPNIVPGSLEDLTTRGHPPTCDPL
jgi:hypothetical protein